MKTSTTLYFKIMGNRELQKYKTAQKIALTEIRKMLQDPLYAKKVKFAPNMESLLLAFKWSATDASFKFWRKTYNIMMNK